MKDVYIYKGFYILTAKHSAQFYFRDVKKNLIYCRDNEVPMIRMHYLVAVRFNDKISR